MSQVSPALLAAYLDEALPVEELTRIEQLLRQNPSLMKQAGLINSRRDAGLHSLGEIWRRHRLTCPNRDQWGSYVLGALPPEVARHLRFHVEVVGCRLCQANLDDLRAKELEQADAPLARRRKYFASSAGYLRRGRR